MAVHIGQPQRALGTAGDRAEVAVDVDRAEIRVADAVVPVEDLAIARWLELEVEGRGLRRLLILPGEAGEAGREGVSDEEVHSFKKLQNSHSQGLFAWGFESPYRIYRCPLNQKSDRLEEI